MAEIVRDPIFPMGDGYLWNLLPSMGPNPWSSILRQDTQPVSPARRYFAMASSTRPEGVPESHAKQVHFRGEAFGIELELVTYHAAGELPAVPIEITDDQLTVENLDTGAIALVQNQLFDE